MVSETQVNTAATLPSAGREQTQNKSRLQGELSVNHFLVFKARKSNFFQCQDPGNTLQTATGQPPL